MTPSSQPAHPVLDLIERAHESLVDAAAASTVPERVAAARLAAARAGGALLATLAPRPAGRPGAGPQDVWVLTRRVAPELAEWAGHFDRLGGIPARRFTPRQADDLVRDAATYLALVGERVGLPQRDRAPARLAPTHARSA